MKKQHIFFAAIILLSSCGAGTKKGSSSVDQDKISTDYTLNYTDDGSGLSGDVSFTSDAKGLHFDSFELDGNSSLTMDGNAIKPTPVPLVGGVTYDFDLKTASQYHTFLYTDNNGKVYSNKCSYDPILITSVKRYLKKDGEWTENEEDPLDTSGVVLIKLSRMPEEGESMDVYLEGNKGMLENDAFDAQSSDDKGEGYLDPTDSTIMFWPSPAGYPDSKKIKFQLRCNMEKEANAPKAGGKISYSWKSKETWFDFVK